VEHDVNLYLALAMNLELEGPPELEGAPEILTRRMQQALNRSELRDLLGGQALTHDRVKRDVTHWDYVRRICEVEPEFFRPVHKRNSNGTSPAKASNGYCDYTGPDNVREISLPEGANLTDLNLTVHTEVCRHTSYNMAHGTRATGHNKGKDRGVDSEHWCKQECVEMPMICEVEVDGVLLTDRIARKMVSFPHGCSCYVS
jgi:hypothetical protein